MEQKEVTGAARLFDWLKEHFKLKNDAALCRALGMAPSDLSNTRAGRKALSAPAIVNILEYSGIPIPRLRRIMKGEE